MHLGTFEKQPVSCHRADDITWTGEVDLQVLASFGLCPDHEALAIECDSAPLTAQKVSPRVDLDEHHIHFHRWHSGKESSCQCRRCTKCRFDPWVRKISCRRIWQPTPVFLPGKSHGQRSQVGYSPQGSKESDTSKHTHTHIP